MNDENKVITFLKEEISRLSSELDVSRKEIGRLKSRINDKVMEIDDLRTTLKELAKV